MLNVSVSEHHLANRSNIGTELAGCRNSLMLGKGCNRQSKYLTDTRQHRNSIKEDGIIYGTRIEGRRVRRITEYKSNADCR